MEGHNDRLKRTRHFLAAAAVIVSATVFAFAVFTILTTDRMTANTETLYSQGYDAMSAARRLQTELLRVTSQVEDYIENPGTERGPEILSELYAWQRKNVQLPASFDMLLTEREKEMLQADLSDLMKSQDRALELMEDDQPERARVILSNEVSPLAQQIDDTLEELIANGADYLQSAIRDTQAMNSRLNLNAVMMACGVVALCVAVSIVLGRTVASGTEEAYTKEVLFNMIARNADDVFEIYDLDEDAVGYASENMERLFGITSAEYMQNPEILRQYIDSADMIALKEAYRDKTLSSASDVDFRYHNPNTGRRQVFHSTIYPIPVAKGEHAYHVMLTRDVSDERESRDKLRQALRDAEISEKTRRSFLTQMSDKLVTPLNAMLGMKALAEKATGDPDKVWLYLRKVLGRSLELTDLATRLVDYAKYEGGDVELKYGVFSLTKLLNSVLIETVERIAAKNQKFETETIDCTVTNLVGDERLLRQVIRNIISNASKFTQSGGNIWLKVRQYPPDCGFVRMSFSVLDNGRGMPKAQLDALVEAFGKESADAGGEGEIGLGLSICHSILHAMGGVLSVQSEEGHGSEFTFEVSFGVAPEGQIAQDTADEEWGEPDALLMVTHDLEEDGWMKQRPEEPVDEEIASNTVDFSGETTEVPNEDAFELAVPADLLEPAPEDDSQPVESMRLLVADDDEFNMEVANAILEDAGFEVDQAVNGKEALDRFEQAEPGWYSAIIMDIQMPVMDGMTATREIRNSRVRDGRGIAILSMSADPFVHGSDEGAKLFDGYLDKPMNAELMPRMIRDAVGRKRGNSSEF